MSNIGSILVLNNTISKAGRNLISSLRAVGTFNVCLQPMQSQTLFVAFMLQSNVLLSDTFKNSLTHCM